MEASTASRVIVVGYDGSEASHAAIRAARREAGPEGELVVVYAYGLPPDFLGFAEYDKLVVDRQAHAREKLDALERDHAADLGTGYEIELIGGSPAEALSDVASARHADMVVVGSRGLGRVRGALGSVSQRLIHLAQVPVLVIPERD